MQNKKIPTGKKVVEKEVVEVPVALIKTNGEKSLLTYTPKDIHTMKAICAKDATDSEFRILMHLAKEYDLDPLKRLIWCVKYGNYPAQIFVGRDGHRAIAERSGFFKGCNVITEKIDEPLLAVDRKGTVVAQREYSYKSTATAFRSDRVDPIISSGYESEYNTGKENWLIRPRTMLEKVAECQALRKAFNISGVYAPEELENKPLTPEYSVGDFPLRSKINKELQENKTVEGWEKIYNKFVDAHGEISLDFLSGSKGGNKNETWGELFEDHRGRVNKENPFDANKPPEDYTEETPEIKEPEDLTEGFNRNVNQE